VGSIPEFARRFRNVQGETAFASWACACRSSGRRGEVTRDRPEVLPTSLAPRGLSRVQAAAYIGVSPNLFEELVKDGRMPKPTRINTRMVWDRVRLDEAFATLSDTGMDGDDEWSAPAV
jgi:hypothetical protein